MRFDAAMFLDEARKAGVLSDEDAARLGAWALGGPDPELQRTRGVESVITQVDRRRADAGGDRSPGPAGRYEIREILGKGGMGEVRLAFDPALKRLVALKRLLDPANEILARRFIQESRVTGLLEHPNVVPVYELELDPARGGPTLAMKRVKGKTLGDVLDAIRAGEPLERGESPERTLLKLLDVFIRITDAMAYAHSQGVIHRDLKPANIMLGPFGEVLVLDWGLAKVKRSDVEELGRSATPLSQGETLAGSVLGTPAYMAPEQARGEVAAIDERSDLYSLGAILYEILSLERPIEAATAQIAIERAKRGDFDPPTKRSAAPWAIPRELEAVVMKAMARRPELRYRSVLALQADIEAFRAGRTLRAVDYAPWEILAKWARRHKAAVAGVMATAVALLLGISGIVWVTARAETKVLREREEARGREADRRREEAARLFRMGDGSIGRTNG